MSEGLLPQYLFNQKVFNESNTTESTTCYSFEKKASLSLVIKKEIAYSPFKAPFGGVECTRELDQQELNEWLRQIVDDLKGSVREIKITLPPESYPNTFVVSKNLMEFGFEIERHELNQSLEITDRTFWDGLHPSEKNKLNKATKAGVVCRKVGLERFEEVFELIRANREYKKFPLTMSADHLKRMVKALPQRYFLFEACLENLSLASIVSIDVGRGVLYNFYMADNHVFRSLSPLVVLNEFVFNWAKNQGYSLVDLGVSSSHGKKNEGLYKFKEYLGAQLSPKYYLSYDINHASKKG